MIRAGRTAVVIGALAVLATTGCGTTIVSTATIPPPGAGESPVIVTTGGVDRPYQSLGLLQVRRSGVTFGWIPVPTDVDLQSVVRDYLMPEARRRGADAIINFRFHESQWAPAWRTITTIPPLLLIPWPVSVTLSGELVRFVPVAGAPATAAASTPPEVAAPAP